MNEILNNIGNWILLVVMIMGFAGVTVETIIKPAIKEIIPGFDDPDGFKASKAYGHLIQFIVFFAVCVEGYAIRTEIDIFHTLGVRGDFTEIAGVLAAAIESTFFSRQIHDVADFFKLWGNSKVSGSKTGASLDVTRPPTDNIGY